MVPLLEFSPPPPPDTARMTTSNFPLPSALCVADRGLPMLADGKESMKPLTTLVLSKTSESLMWLNFFEKWREKTFLGDGGRKKLEPVFLNVYGAKDLIPRNEFRQPM